MLLPQEAFGFVQEQKEPHYFEDMYSHAIRHIFCSRCFEAGMQPKVVQSIMGHANDDDHIGKLKLPAEQAMEGSIEGAGSGKSEVCGNAEKMIFILI